MDLLNRSEKIFKVCAYLLVIAFAAVTLYPIVYAFSVSISGRVAYESGSIVLLPKDVTLQAYDMVLHSKGFWIAYANTLFYTVVGTAWSMFISLTGAYALQKKKLKFRRQWNFLLVFTMWFSAGMIPLYLNYKSMNVDNRWGMIIAFGVQAYNIILLRNYFDSIPKEIEEAALVDGATEFQLFSRFYVPMSTASIATVLCHQPLERLLLVENAPGRSEPAAPPGLSAAVDRKLPETVRRIPGSSFLFSRQPGLCNHRLLYHPGFGHLSLYPEIFCQGRQRRRRKRITF